MKKPETLTGSCDSKGLFKAKNPYLPISGNIIKVNEYNQFGIDHPQALCYTPSSELVTDVENVEVKPAHQIETTKGWSVITDDEYEVYENSNAKLRPIYITVPPTEKDLTDAKPFNAIDEAQPLEGVKTTSKPVSEMNELEYKVYKLENALTICKNSCECRLSRIKELDAQFATDAGGGKESELREIIFTIGEISFERRLEVYNKLKAALSSPSTHSSSEMVKGWISVTDRMPKPNIRVRAIRTFGNGKREEIHTHYVERIETFDDLLCDIITHWQYIVLPK